MQPIRYNDMDFTVEKAGHSWDIRCSRTDGSGATAGTGLFAGLGDADREYLSRTISAPGAVFINHTKDFEFFPGVNGKLVKYAADAGYRREVMAVIPDSNGRPVYEVYRFVVQ